MKWRRRSAGSRTRRAVTRDDPIQLGVHHGVVERVLDAENVVARERPPRPSKLDPYKPFVLRKLDEHPTLRAKRLYTR